MPLPNPTLTLVSNANNVAGFNDNKMNVPTRYNQSLEDVLTSLNSYRSPTNKIVDLYNSLEQKIPLGLKIKENTVLYIDTINMPYDTTTVKQYKHGNCKV